MEEPYLPSPGSVTQPDDLTIPKARDMAVRLRDGEIQYADLIECRQHDGTESVVFDVRVEVPNKRVHPIARRERIAATFSPRDSHVPRVEALRRDFPVVPHLNLHLQEFPRSLCLYEEPYRELKRRWTSARFVGRIREWLRLNARGELHAADQALEPILIDYAGHVVLPHGIETLGNTSLSVSGVIPEGNGKWFLEVTRAQPADGKARPPQFIPASYACEPRVHGLIHRCPRTLDDLSGIAHSAGLDLIGELRRALPEWRKRSLDARVLLVISFPKTRTKGSPVESTDTWCFLTDATVKKLSLALGLFGAVGSSAGMLLEIDKDKRGQDVPVFVLNPSFELTRERAARLNGRAARCDMRIVGIGAGALGSHVTMNLARAGFGRWTLIDHDRLMPHNVARHTLGYSFVGWSKAEAMALLLNNATAESDAAVGIDSEAQTGGDDVRAALSSAEAVIDMTASVAMQRHLARDLDSDARRVCMFLTPSGTDLVVFAEDAARRVRLDALEMQYYRAILHDADLAGHIEAKRDQQRYARSCGDTTSAMPQDLVALHSSIASRNVKRILESETPTIEVWRSDERSGVRHVPVKVRTVTEFTTGAWTIVLDEGFRDRLAQLRTEKLPNETGGVLLGSFDLERRILYLVDTLASPPDSEERRDLYIRGFSALRQGVDDVEAKTGGMLKYIGEWHSHPRGSSTQPSGFDLAAFGWLTTLMSGDGIPAVMMIIGDDEMSLFVGSMGDAASPIPEDEHAQVA